MIASIALQELRQRVRSPGFWVLLALLFTLLGLLFLGLMEEFVRTIQPANLQREKPVPLSDGLMLPYFWWCGLIVPALMPLLASGAALSRNTAASLLYRLSPVGNATLVSGRMLGLLLIQTLIVLTAATPALLFSTVATLDQGQLISSLIGLWLMTLQAASLSLYLTVRIRDGLAAILTSYAVLLLLGMLYLLGNIRGGSGELLFQLASFSHYRPWLEARFDSRHLAYFLLSSLLFFALAIHAWSYRDRRHDQNG